MDGDVSSTKVGKPRFAYSQSAAFGLGGVEGTPKAQGAGVGSEEEGGSVGEEGLVSTTPSLVELLAVRTGPWQFWQLQERRAGKTSRFWTPALL